MQFNHVQELCPDRLFVYDSTILKHEFVFLLAMFDPDDFDRYFASSPITDDGEKPITDFSMSMNTDSESNVALKASEFGYRELQEAVLLHGRHFRRAIPRFLYH